MEALGRRARLIAERDNRPEVEFPEELDEQIPLAAGIRNGERASVQGQQGRIATAGRNNFRSRSIRPAKKSKAWRRGWGRRRRRSNSLAPNGTSYSTCSKRRSLDYSRVYTASREWARLLGERGEIEASIASDEGSGHEVKLQSCGRPDRKHGGAARAARVDARISELKERKIAIRGSARARTESCAGVRLHQRAFHLYHRRRHHPGGEDRDDRSRKCLAKVRDQDRACRHRPGEGRAASRSVSPPSTGTPRPNLPGGSRMCRRHPPGMPPVTKLHRPCATTDNLRRRSSRMRLSRECRPKSTSRPRSEARSPSPEAHDRPDEQGVSRTIERQAKQASPSAIVEAYCRRESSLRSPCRDLADISKSLARMFSPWALMRPVPSRFKLSAAVHWLRAARTARECLDRIARTTASGQAAWPRDDVFVEGVRWVGLRENIPGPSRRSKEKGRRSRTSTALPHSPG